MQEPEKRQVTRGGPATVFVWHLAAGVAFAGWVLTWPEEVNTGGDLGFTTTRSTLAILLAVLLVAPGLIVSLTVASGVLLVLRRWWRPSGVVAGTIASLAGLVTVAALLAIYSATRG